MATKQKEVEKWITVNGVHVPVFKGQSVEEAVKKVTGKKDGGSNKQPSKTKDQSVKKDELKENKQISKDQDLKEKQIADNEKQAKAAEKEEVNKQHTSSVSSNKKVPVSSKPEHSVGTMSAQEQKTFIKHKTQKEMIQKLTDAPVGTTLAFGDKNHNYVLVKNEDKSPFTYKGNNIGSWSIINYCQTKNLTDNTVETYDSWTASKLVHELDWFRDMPVLEDKDAYERTVAAYKKPKN